MSFPLYIVDAFTDKPFGGNPAAICILEDFLNDVWLQNVASEMNLSETSFLVRESEGWKLRWFTPVSEVDLCGHATLASAHLLWDTKRETGDSISFSTRSGKLVCRKSERGITMDFPSVPATEVAPIPELNAGLRVKPLWVGRSKLDVIALVDSEETLRSLSPDQLELDKIATRGIIVTANSSNYDFVSRAFFPRLGVPEDPVCGSAHCGLGPFWAERLGKSDMVACQVSKRGGIIYVQCRGERVMLSGQAVTVTRGEILAVR